MPRVPWMVRSLLFVALLLLGCSPTASLPLTATPIPTAANPTAVTSAPATPAVSSATAAPSETTVPSATAAPSPTGAPTSTAASASAPTTLPSPTVPLPTSTTAASASVYPLTVTDDAGRKVTFDHAPRRIISLSPGHTETLYALGVGDRIVVTDKYSDYPAENQPKAKLDTYPKPNLEQLVSLKPDLIVVLVEGDDVLQQLDQQKIPTLKLFPTTFDATLNDILLLGQVTGTSPKAEQITANMRERAAAVTAKTKGAPKVAVLYELDASDPTKPFVAGPGGFYGSLIPLAGGKNVFDDLNSSAAQVSAEQIIARDPAVILMGDTTSPFNAQTPAMLKARPGWNQISAVKSGHIYAFNDALLTRPGPRLIDGLEQVAKLLHPELFP